MPHIILADDDAAMRQFLTLSLTRAGHAVSAFPDGRAAFDHLANPAHPADLLLTDIVMPGMDGIELALRARHLRPSLKTLYITGFGTVAGDEITQGPVLAKPLHLKAVLGEIDRILADFPLPPSPPGTTDT